MERAGRVRAEGKAALAATLEELKATLASDQIEMNRPALSWRMRSRKWRSCTSSITLETSLTFRTSWRVSGWTRRKQRLWPAVCRKTWPAAGMTPAAAGRHRKGTGSVDRALGPCSGRGAHIAARGPAAPLACGCLS